MSRITAHIRAFFHHEQYHGWFRKRRFFEGWYFKMVDRTGAHAYAFIPGIAMDAAGKRQAFIQVLDGIRVTAQYHAFDPDFFRPYEKRFKVKLQDNSFSMNRIKLQLPDIKGQIHFSEHTLWPKKWWSPGIMGWYSFVPFMECYHQVVSLDCALTGKLIIHGKEVDFNGGRGYIEKDWGRSFPSSWIWMQSNHFSATGTSFKLSVARIPWVGNAFVGFICALLLNGRIYRFATYTGAKLRKIDIYDAGAHIVLEDARHILEVRAEKAPGAELASPVLGLMEGRVKESMQALIHIQLRDKKENRLIFSDTGKNAGLEIAGNTHELLAFSA